MADEITGQSKVHTEINSLLNARSKILAEQTKLMGSQVDITNQLKALLEDEFLGNAKDSIEETSEALEEMGEKAEEAEKKTTSLSGVLGGLAAGAALGAVTGAVGGAVKGFQGLFSLFKVGIGAVGDLITNFFNLAKSIIALPFKLLNNLTDMAENIEINLSLALAIEKVRGQFGNLATNEGKSVMQAFKGIRKEAGNLAGSGMSLSKIFGMGIDGLAAALEYVAESAKALGPLFNTLQKEFIDNAAAITIYRKGLALSDEAFQSLAMRGMASGKGMNKTLHEFSNYAVQMGKKFGISSKIVSEGMQEMATDTANFGQLAIKELSSATVYTSKLGIKIKELVSLIDKFDNFEDAAKSASMLNQQFGIQVDALEMINEQDPAARLSKLQKAFAATGKSVEGMSRQEMKLLSSTTGLSAEATKLAFSQRGLGMSYEDVQKGADGAGKKQMTQIEAMQALSKNISRVIQTVTLAARNFFDAFLEGFERGIKYWSPFRELLMNLRTAMREVYFAGMRVGQMFIENFPGIEKIIDALKDLFSPGRFRKFAHELTSTFGKLFKDLQTDPQAGFQTFINRFLSLFENTFGGNSGTGILSKLKEGSKEILNVLTNILASGIKIAMEKVTEGIGMLTNFLRDPEEFLGQLSTKASDMSSFVSKILEPIFIAIQGAWPLLKKAFDKLFSQTTWDAIYINVDYFWKTKVTPQLDKLWKYLEEWWEKPDTKEMVKTIKDKLGSILYDVFTSSPVFWLLAARVAPAMLFSMLKGMFTGAAAEGAWKWLKGSLSGMFSKTAASAATEGLSSGLMGGIRTAVGSIGKKLPWIALAIAAADGLQTAFNSKEKGMDTKISIFAAQTVGTFAKFMTLGLSSTINKVAADVGKSSAQIFNEQTKILDEKYDEWNKTRKEGLAFDANKNLTAEAEKLTKLSPGIQDILELVPDIDKTEKAIIALKKLDNAQKRASAAYTEGIKNQQEWGQDLVKKKKLQADGDHSIDLKKDIEWTENDLKNSAKLIAKANADVKSVISDNFLTFNKEAQNEILSALNESHKDFSSELEKTMSTSSPVSENIESIAKVSEASIIEQIEKAESIIESQQKLAKIQPKLEKAKAALESLDLEGLKAVVAKAFEKLAKISNVINTAFNDAKFDKTAINFEPMFKQIIDPLEKVNTVTSMIDKVFSSKTGISDEKMKISMDRIVANISKIPDFMTSLSAAASEVSDVDVKSLQASLASINNLIGDKSSLVAPLAVDFVKAMNKGGKLTVSHVNQPINVTINLTVDSKELAKSIVKTTLEDKSGSAYSKSGSKEATNVGTVTGPISAS